MPQAAPQVPPQAGVHPGAPSPGDAEPGDAVPCRSRPRSLPEVTSSYTNPAYFIFEGLPATWALGADTQEDSPVWGPPQAQTPLPSPCRSLLSPPGVGRQKRPKSAVLARDVPEGGDCSLTVLHMATDLSQLDRMLPRDEGHGHQMLLHQSHSAPQPPPPRCRRVPGHGVSAYQHGHHREVQPWDVLLAKGPPPEAPTKVSLCKDTNGVWMAEGWWCWGARFMQGGDTKVGISAVTGLKPSLVLLSPVVL